MLKKKDLADSKQKIFSKYFIDDDKYYSEALEFVLFWDNTGCVLARFSEINGELDKIKNLKDMQDLIDSYELETGRLWV